MSGSTAAADHGHHHVDPSYRLAHHFEAPEQQFDSGKLGTWLFLVTEILFFSGLFVAYSIYRTYNPELFKYAHHYLDTNLGAINTIVLLFSSLTAAWAVRCAQLGQRALLNVMLLVTIGCAMTFMVIKYFEYEHKIHIGLFPVAGHEFVPLEDAHHEPFTINGQPNPKAEPAPPGLRTFFGIYFCMTGLHGIHVLVGIGLLTWLLLRNLKGHFGKNFFGPVDFVALYWHIVDLIWIFLFPLLYLIR